jgi:cytochrome c2
MRISLIISFLSILIACNSNKSAENGKEEVIEKTEKLGNHLSVNLLEIQKQFGESQIVEIQNDPVYHKSKRFNVLPLNAILEKHSNIKSLKIADYRMVFECEDGYKPEMSLEKLVNANAFLAISDVDAPKGRDWEQIIKDGHEMKAAPFYVVYTNVNPKDGSYKWPYNLVKMHLEPLNADLAMIEPRNSAGKKGFELFQKSCQTCHAINGVGGEMGPDLNYPKNITEYWHETDLKAFIKNPSAYRHNVKMPTLELTDADISEIILYLKVMKEQKRTL